MRRPALLAAFWLLTSGGVLALSSCYGRNCEPSVKTWGENPGEGSLIDENTWESQPVNAPWLDFPGGRTWIMNTRLLGERFADVPTVYISGSNNPVANGQNFTVAGGNLAQITVSQPGSVLIANGTCAEYFVRVVVRAAPVPPDPAPQADAGVVVPSDAGTDAGDGG